LSLAIVQGIALGLKRGAIIPQMIGRNRAVTALP
jgi:hypothetical protein